MSVISKILAISSTLFILSSSQPGMSTTGEGGASMGNNYFIGYFGFNATDQVNGYFPWPYPIEVCAPATYMPVTTYVKYVCQGDGSIEQRKYFDASCQLANGNVTRYTKSQTTTMPFDYNCNGNDDYLVVNIGCDNQASDLDVYVVGSVCAYANASPLTSIMWTCRDNTNDNVNNYDGFGVAAYFGTSTCAGTGTTLATSSFTTCSQFYTFNIMTQGKDESSSATMCQDFTTTSSPTTTSGTTTTSGNNGGTTSTGSGGTTTEAGSSGDSEGNNHVINILLLLSLTIINIFMC
jgi:hypothetical protein